MPNELVNLDKILEEWLDPLTKFIIDYDNAHGHETARQFLLQRVDFQPHFYDRLVGLTQDLRYQTKKFARDYLMSGKTPYHTSLSHITGHPDWLASTVYDIINKFPDVWLELQGPKVAAGHAIVIGNFFSCLFTVTALDMGEMPAPLERANFVLNQTKKWVNSV